MRILEQEQLNPCTVKMTVEVEADRVQEAVQQARRQIAKQLRVPGFRPGKAPAYFVDQMVPKDDLYRRAAEQLVPQAYREAVEEAGLEPYGAPSLQLDVFEEGVACRFTAKVGLAPKVQLGEYKGLSAQRPDPTPTDEEVERELAEMRRRRAKQIPLDRPAESGDLAVLDITSLENEETKRFMVIVGQTFGQLDQLLVGMRPGEEKSASLTFPNDFEEGANWAGKLMDCTVRMESLSKVEMPAADDEFAKAMKRESIEALRAEIRGTIGAIKEAMADEQVTEQLFTRLLENSTVEIPDSMWESVYQERIAEIEQEQARNNSSFEALAAAEGISVEELRARVAADAQMQVKRALLIRDIAEAEQIELTQEDLDYQIRRLADRARVSFEVARREIQKQDGMDEVRFRALFRKVADLLKEHAHIVTVQAR
ncbi:MAG: trigger factor [Fimbriimonadales bacterium]